MKTRNGFVSNSSSSSFIIIGTPTKIQDLKPKDIENELYVIGTYLGEGLDVISVNTLGMLKFIKKYSEEFGKAYKNARITMEDEIIISEDMIGKEIFSGLKDQCSANTLEALKERYQEDYNGEN